MRGINRVILTGDVVSDLKVGETGSGRVAGSFQLECDRSHIVPDTRVTVQVNLYGSRFVGVARNKLKIGGHVLVDGELMNRYRKDQQILEVRVNELVFYD